MTETQASIAEWADATFGPAKSLASIAARANREMSELVQAVVDGASNEHLIVEAADVAICLYRYGHVCGRDLRSYASPPTALSKPADLALGASMVLRDLIRDSLRPSESAAARMARAACVLNYLRHLCRECGADLDRAIDEKMKINRARKWKLDGNGHGQHVEAA